jgi:hypothetical protein
VRVFADNDACGGRNILDEVLLASAGGLDRRRLLDGLGAAAGKEEDAAEHGAEDTDRKLVYAACQLLYSYVHPSCVSSPRDVHRRAPSRIPPHDCAERVCRPRA